MSCLDVIPVFSGSFEAFQKYVLGCSKFIPLTLDGYFDSMKNYFFVLLAVLIVAGFSSCHRGGCPSIPGNNVKKNGKPKKDKFHHEKGLYSKKGFGR
jgi:hypothetical protein